LPLIYLSCAWIAGIFLGSKFGMPPAFIVLGLTPLLALLRFRRHRKAIVLTSLCLVAILAGAIRFQSSMPAVDAGSLQSYNDSGMAEIKGKISTDPDVREKTTRLRLSATEIRLDNSWQKVSGTALVFVPRYPAYSYGDELLIRGKLETPAQLDDFDYRGYLAHQGIYSTMLYPGIEVLEQGKGLKPLEQIYSL